MTSTDRAGSYNGSYEDDGLAVWKYTCPQPPAPPANAESATGLMSSVASAIALYAVM